jgi:hypothetical protein
MRYQTRHWTVKDVYENASIGDTEDCVHVTIAKDDIFDLMSRLLEHIRCGEGDYGMTLPCTLERVK